MKPYGQTRCSKCTAIISTDNRVCLFCGLEQDASPTKQHRAKAAGVSSSVPPSGAYKLPTQSSTNYSAPYPRSANRSPALMIAGGVLLIATFFAYMIASTHNSLPTRPTNIDSNVGDNSAFAAPTSSDPSAGRVEEPVAPTDARPVGSDNNVAIAEGDPVLNYCMSLDYDALALTNSLTDLLNAIRSDSGSPQPLSNADWKARVTEQGERVREAAATLENLAIVPAECATLQEKVRRFAQTCDALGRDCVDSQVSADAQADSRILGELGSMNRQKAEIKSDEVNLRARHGDP